MKHTIWATSLILLGVVGRSLVQGQTPPQGKITFHKIAVRQTVTVGPGSALIVVGTSTSNSLADKIGMMASNGGMVDLGPCQLRMNSNKLTNACSESINVYEIEFGPGGQ